MNIEAAMSRMKEWAAANPSCDTQGIMDDEWLCLAAAAVDQLKFVSAVRIGDTVTDAFYGTTFEVVGIQGGAAFTFYGPDGEVIRNLAPDYLVPVS